MTTRARKTRANELYVRVVRVEGDEPFQQQPTPQTLSSRVARALSLAWLASLPLACDSAEEPLPRRPSVILISIDTLRADHMGHYGYERDTTPYLDRLAEESLVFEQAYAAASWTLVSHMTMLTGLFPSQHGVLDGDWALHGEVPVLAERLGEAGYQTVGLYRPGWIHERHGFARGFDVFQGHDNAEQAEAHLLETFAELDNERPFFLFLHLFDVHSAPFIEGETALYRPPPEYARFFQSDVEERLPDVPARDQHEGDYALDAEELEALIATYDGGIRYVDAKLEAWLGELEKGGWLDNTLLVVTSDHGEALGQRNGKLNGHGGFFQEGLVVPLLVRIPSGERAGERVATPVHHTDLVPTVMQVVGLARDPLLSGHSLLDPQPQTRILTGSKGHLAALPESPSSADRPPVSEYILEWPRKAVASRGRAKGFDLEKDPGEEHPIRLSEDDLRALRARVAEGRPDPERFPEAIPIESEDEALLQDLRALGYAGEGGS